MTAPSPLHVAAVMERLLLKDTLECLERGDQPVPLRVSHLIDEALRISWEEANGGSATHSTPVS